MVLVLFFLGLTIVIIFLTILVMMMSIELEINNFRFYKEEKQKIQIAPNYKIIIYFTILKNKRIFKININSKRIQKYYNNKKENFSILILLKLIFIEKLKNKGKSIEIKNLDLDLEIGIEDVLLTSGAVTILNAIFPIFISKYVSNYNNQNYKYKVIPIYNKNTITLILNCNTKLELIYILKIFKKYIESKKEGMLK